MYVLIYDEHFLDRPEKKILSTHKSRDEAETALEERKKELGRRVWECHTRVVWVEKETHAGDTVGPGEYDTWRPGEDIPPGELYPDSD